MAWLKSDCAFQERAKILTISRRSAFAQSLYRTLAGIAHPDPVAVEAVLGAEIDRVRPELCGCCIWHLNFNAATSEWEVAVSHRSLDPVCPGSELVREPLYQDAPDPACMV